MFDDSAHVLARTRRVLSEHVWPAVHRDRTPLTTAAWHVPGEPVHLFLEAAGNPAVMKHGFRPTSLGDRATAGGQPQYVLGRVDIAVLDREVFGLVVDLDVLLDLATELPERDARRLEICAAVDDALMRLDVHAVGHCATSVREALVAVLHAPANASAQRLTAVGHAHIDSAWLWPVRETVRKCARTFTNVTALAADYPELTFACSSAQQYAWMKER